MKSGQPLRPEDKRDIDIAMETKRRAGGSGLGTRLCSVDVCLFYKNSRMCAVMVLISMYKTGHLKLGVTSAKVKVILKVEPLTSSSLPEIVCCITDRRETTIYTLVNFRNTEIMNQVTLLNILSRQHTVNSQNDVILMLKNNFY